MQENLRSLEEEQWVVWNGSLGVRDFATIGRIEEKADKMYVWLDEPYDMVGPLCLEELETNGQISFAACIVMSYQKWQDEQVSLRQKSFEKRRRAEEQLYEDLSAFNRRKRSQQVHTEQCDEKAHRELLKLPIEGELVITQIKSAYRRVAKKAHPDVGGSQELFMQIKEARDALMKQFL